MNQNKTFRFAIAAIFLASSPSLARAETIWSYYPLGLQTWGHEIITSCDISLCFYYGYDSHGLNGTYSPEIMHETIDSSSQGKLFSVTAETDPNFNEFVSRILKKDNLNDLICVRMTTNNGTDLSTGTVKSVVFNGCPDLSHQKISSVSLKINELTLDTTGGDIWHDGKCTYLSEAFTFSIGIPEPGSLVLLSSALFVVGVFCALRKK